MSGEIGIDLFFRRLRRINVGNDLNDLSALFSRRLVDGVDAELGIGVNQESGEVGNLLTAATAQSP